MLHHRRGLPNGWLGIAQSTCAIWPLLTADEQATIAAAADWLLRHELADKLDMLDGTIDGTPPLGGRVPRQRWIAVCTEAYDALRTGVDRPPLRDDAATNVGEFFAVATEAFFDAPRALRTHEPDLYGILAAAYGQDPAARLERAAVPE